MGLFDQFLGRGDESGSSTGSGKGEGADDGRADGEGGIRGLITTVRSLPDLITRLIRAEIALARAELVAKLKKAGIGIGMIAAAALFAFLLLEVLVAAAILGLATAFSPWLSALLVAAGLLIVAAVFGLVGYRMLKKGTPPLPTETVKNVKADADAAAVKRDVASN